MYPGAGEMLQSRRGQRTAAGVVPEECGLLKRSCEGTGWPKWPGNHLLAPAPCRLHAELHVLSTVWSVGSRAGEPHRAWAASRHPSCFVSLLLNRLLFKKLVVCSTRVQGAAALLPKAQVKVLQGKCPGQAAAVWRARGACPQASPVGPVSYAVRSWIAASLSGFRGIIFAW